MATVALDSVISVGVAVVAMTVTVSDLVEGRPAVSVVCTVMVIGPVVVKTLFVSRVPPLIVNRLLLALVMV